MTRLLAKYFPLAVLAIGLVLGMVAAVMALWPGTTSQVYAATQQVVDDSMQVYLGSASDPGGGLTISTPATITIAFADIPYGEQNLGLRLESAHLTEPIGVQSGSQNVYFHDVNDNGTLTNTLGQQNVAIVTTIAGLPTRLASLQSSCSQQSIDGLQNLSGVLPVVRANLTRTDLVRVRPGNSFV